MSIGLQFFLSSDYTHQNKGLKSRTLFQVHIQTSEPRTESMITLFLNNTTFDWADKMHACYSVFAYQIKSLKWALRNSLFAGLLRFAPLLPRLQRQNCGEKPVTNDPLSAGRLSSNVTWHSETIQKKKIITERGERTRQSHLAPTAHKRAHFAPRCVTRAPNNMQLNPTLGASVGLSVRRCTGSLLEAALLRVS